MVDQIYLTFMKFLKFHLKFFQKLKIYCKNKILKILSLTNNNPYFFQSILPMLKFQLKICEKLNASPIIMENGLNFKVKLIKSKMVLAYIRTHSIIVFLHMLISAIWLSGYYKKISFSKAILSSFFLIGPGMLNMAKEAILYHSLDMVKLLNAFKEFEDLHLKG